MNDIGIIKCPVCKKRYNTSLFSCIAMAILLIIFSYVRSIGINIYIEILIFVVGFYSALVFPPVTETYPGEKY